MKLLLCIRLLLIVYLMHVAWSKMILKKIQLCEKKNYPIAVDFTTYFEHNQQFVNANSTFKIPFSNELKGTLRVDLVIGNNPFKIISVTENHACSSLHKYLGKFIYDVERAAGLVPGLCPVPKGRYRIDHHLIELEKISIRGFPVGHLKFTVSSTNQNNEIVSCVKGDVDNM